MIDHIFDRMDHWRHLPAYQLERRADIFFAAYLPEFLAERYGHPVTALVPEFPVRVGTIRPDIDINKSFKVDYLVQFAGCARVILLELKTDPASRRDKQDWYLRAAREAGIPALMDGVVRIAGASTSKRKYAHLLRELAAAGLVERHPDLGWRATPGAWSTEILYLQPRSPEPSAEIVDFATFARFVASKGDPVSLRFARSLLEWGSVDAGESEPA